MITNEQIEKCVEIAGRYGARRLILFGSAAHDPEHARDIDLMCEGVDGMEIFGMGAEMEEETHTEIDIVPIPPMNRFARYNLSRGRVLFENR